MDILILVVLLFNLLLTWSLVMASVLGRLPHQKAKGESERLSEEEDKKRRLRDEGLANLMDYEPPTTGLTFGKGD
jgi:hypothetical protein